MEEYEMADMMKLQNGSDIRGIACEGVARYLYHPTHLRIMAKVKPFRGIRPPREIVTEVASRPYDVLNSEEARTEAEGNPRSLYHIIKPEIDFAPGTDEHSSLSRRGGSGFLISPSL